MTTLTESPHTQHTNLDRYDTLALVQAFVDDQALAARAVQQAAVALAAAVDAAAARLQAGGRLIYVGAGTSGRLGVLDGVELRPTFSWPTERAVGLLAGGLPAMFVAVEGAEDDLAQGRNDVMAVNPGIHDVVIGITASGTTPYVLGALQAAKSSGALTIGVANNPGAAVTELAELGIVLDTGPEVISGSTRLKAGTAQKIALNTLSSALMVRLNKVYGNLMVDLQATNAKLIRRAEALTLRATGAPVAQVKDALQACGQRVKVAIVMLKAQVTVEEAEHRLERAQGRVEDAVR
ncbi:MAG: N-acetylmuramic acid 6-phosphate etherase [Betaproteobacteria bacterium]|nr:N-acetylmuramic acid 6-phosphate etherase [Betaproteobacteria bacterium]